MKAARTLVAGVCLFGVALAFTTLQAPASAQAPAPAQQAASAHQALVAQYCVTCHNQRLKTGNLVLDPAALASPAADIEVWEKVTRKLRAGLMPPPGSPRPSTAALDALTIWLEGELDRAAARSPNPGRPMLHRLNRSEYANAIRDLLLVEVDPAL